MKCAAFYTVALACCLGLVLADFNDIYGSVMGGGYGAGYGNYGGYGGYGQATYVPVPAYGGAQRGAGNGSFLGLIGMLFLLLVLFGSGTNSNSDQIVLINSTLEG